LFRKQSGYTPGEFPNDRFGSSTGDFDNVRAFKLVRLLNDPNRSPSFTDIRQFRVEMDRGVLTTTDYNAVVNINQENISPDSAVNAYVLSPTRTLTSFDFFITDVFGSAPTDVYEISIMVY
jgi:hypothetical protein